MADQKERTEENTAVTDIGKLYTFDDIILVAYYLANHSEGIPKSEMLDEIRRILSEYPNEKDKLQLVQGDKEQTDRILEAIKKELKDTISTTNKEPFEIEVNTYNKTMGNSFSRGIMSMIVTPDLLIERASLIDDMKNYSPKPRNEGISTVTMFRIDTNKLGNGSVKWGVTEKRLFGMYNEFICNYGDERHPELNIPIRKYMEKCGITSNENNKKKLIRELRQSLKILFSAYVSQEEKENIAYISLFEGAAYEHGHIKLVGTRSLIQAMQAEKRQIMHLPSIYYTYKGKNAVSVMNVIQLLSYNYGIYNNVCLAEKYGNHRNEKLTVCSILKETDIITIEDVRKTGQSWKSKIKQPFEIILNVYPGRDCWTYEKDGKAILPEAFPKSLTYEEWEQLVVRYNIEDFPIDDVKKGIEAKKERAAERRQIQYDKAAIARDQSERRQERREKENKQNK